MSQPRKAPASRRAPYATRDQPWTASTATAYGSALKSESIGVEHKKDLDTCFNYVRWGGLAPGRRPLPEPSEEGSRSFVSTEASQVTPILKREAREKPPADAVREIGHAALDKSARFGGVEVLGLHGGVGYGSGLYPQASRGQVSGRHQTWAFERMPSLLPQPLLRGVRSCGVAPPTSAAQWPHAAASRLSLQSAASSGDLSAVPSPGFRIPTSKPAHLVSGEEAHEALRSLVRSSSVPGLPRSKGLHGMIGMGWDNSATAGGAYRGSGGEFVGF
mmetsp:Transcript_3096/g.5968  ORF Transcript_3096/g.5968 Transcript_3096/m.5968 type:complete len:275 (-) Transcript_3096:94-918(-)